MWILRTGLLAASLAAAPLPSLDRLFTRPYVWGTQPEALAWSRTGHVLGFLWNESGGRFLDLYAATPQGKRVRLTNLESFRDPLLATPSEKDSRQSKHIEPGAGIAAFSLSHDGRRAVFSFKDDLWLVPTDGSAPAFRLTRTKASESAPEFTRDGSAVTAIENGQVILRRLTGGQHWQLTDVEAPQVLLGYRLSPDGKRLAYLVRRSATRRMPLPNYSGRFVAARDFPRSVAGDDAADAGLFVTTIEGAPPVELDQASWGPRVWHGELEWSPDSSTILWRAVHPLMKQQRLLAADAVTGKSRILDEESDPSWVYWSEYGWSPDSKNIWFTSERDGWPDLYTLPASGGKPTQVTRGNFETRAETFTRDPKWAADGLYFSSTEYATSERHLVRVRPDGTGKQRLSQGEGIHDGLATDDGAHIAWLHADLNSPFDLWINTTRITTSPRPEFSQFDWPRTRFVSFPSRHDKATVHAKLLLPPGYAPEAKGRQWPSVFFIHGAGYATSVLKQWGSYQVNRYVLNASLAAQGYVIMDLDYRGSSGYGRAWRTGVYRDMGGPDLGDVLGAVDYLKTLGNIDTSRLGIWGVSYGGFMTNMAMFRAPEVFRAGAGWASVNDWENYNSFYTTQRLDTPALAPEAYRRSSPIHFSQNLRNPLLIIHGMVDSNVLFQDAVQLTGKLIAEGKDFAHFYYPEEDHGFVRDETWIDAARRTAAWFERFLK